MTQNNHLELQLHGSNRFTGRRLGEFLDVGEQVARRNLGVATRSGLQQGFVDKDVLVLGLDHVVPLGAHARHVAVDVYGLLVLHALQHGIDHDEAAGPAHARTDGGRTDKKLFLTTYYFYHLIIFSFFNILLNILF